MDLLKDPHSALEGGFRTKLALERGIYESGQNLAIGAALKNTFSMFQRCIHTPPASFGDVREGGLLCDAHCEPRKAYAHKSFIGYAQYNY